jgi:cell division protein FtsB
LLAICAGALVLYLGVLSGQRALDGYRARQQVTTAVQEIETLRSQNLMLQAELNAALLPDEVERIARNELGLVRPGDNPVVLIWPDGGPPASTARADTPAPVARRWREWLRLFID